MQNTEIMASRLSMQQANLWSLQGWNSAYQSWCVISLKGQLDRREFFKAVQYSMKRQEILRTLFRPLPGTDIPVQVVTHEESCFYALSDWQRIAPTDQQAELDRFLAHLQQKTYDLEHGPLLSIWLLQRATDEHMLLVHLPALCADAYTLNILVEELLHVYLAVSQSEASADDPLQYADVSVWQEDLLLEEDAELHRRYWHKIDLSHLSSSYIPLTREARVRNQAVEGGQSTPFLPEQLNVSLEKDLYPRIHSVSQELHVSLPAIFLACWKLLLWRLVGVPDAIIGTACDGRTHEELRTALGLYTRFVPINTYFERSYFIEQILVAIDLSLQEAVERQAYFSWESGTAATHSRENAQFFPLSFEYNTWPASLTTGSLNASLYEWYSCVERFHL